MILDSKLEFCDATDVSATAGTALVGDVIDLDTIGRYPGDGQNISVYVNVSTAFASGGAATVNFVVASDAAAAIATDGTATEHYRSQAFAIADLTAGAMVHLRIPGGLPAAERYLGLLVVTGTATTTAGAINAGLTFDAHDYKTYPDAVN